MRRSVVLGGCAIVTLALGAVGASRVERRVPVDVATTKAVPDFSDATIPCSIRFAGQASLRAEITGIVRAIRVRPGQHVVRGQPLIELDTDTLKAQETAIEAQVAAAQAAITNKEATSDIAAQAARRLVALRQSGFGAVGPAQDAVSSARAAKAAVDQARADLDVAKAQLVQNRVLLSKAVIRSPIDGVVLDVSVSQGETAIATAVDVPGSELVVVADTSHPQARLRVDEEDVLGLSIGQDVTISTPALPGRRYGGTIRAISPSAPTQPDAQGRPQFLVTADVADAPEFRSGMTCRATMRVDRHRIVLLVPNDAVIFDDDRSDAGAIVYQVRDNRAVRTEVDVGPELDGKQSITRGLAPGALVLAKIPQWIASQRSALVSVRRTPLP